MELLCENASLQTVHNIKISELSVFNSEGCTEFEKGKFTVSIVKKVWLTFPRHTALSNSGIKTGRYLGFIKSLDFARTVEAGTTIYYDKVEA